MGALFGTTAVDGSEIHVDWWALLANASQVVAAAGVICTLLITIWQVRKQSAAAEHSRQLSEKSMQQAENAAAAGAERSENATRLTLDQMQKVTDALEAIATKDFGGGAKAPEPKVRWELTHFNGDTYLLQNVGNATAYGVEVTSHESLRASHYNWPKGEGAPFESEDWMKFMAATTLGTVDTTITVSWANMPDGLRQQWKWPLPPKVK